MEAVKEKKTAIDVAKEFQAKKPLKDSKPNADAKDKDQKDSKAVAQPAAGSSPEKKTAEEASVKTEKTNDKPVDLSDAQLIETPDEKLSPELKEKKGKLVETQRLPNAEKRINELIGELKALKNEKNQDKELIKRLEADLSSLKSSIEAPKHDQELSRTLAQKESERIKRYAQEDQAKPRHERREIPKDELENWLIEDPVSANEWLSDRAVRRAEERKADQSDLKATSQANEIVQRQKRSQERVLAKHPDINFEARTRALTAEGKSPSEIQAIIFKENPKVRILAEIMRESGDKYQLDPDGPENLMLEMERRLATVSKGESQDEKEARIAAEAAEAERQRQANIDEGLRSSNGGTPPVKMTEQYEKRLKVFQRAGLSKADLDRAIERRKRLGLE